MAAQGSADRDYSAIDPSIHSQETADVAFERLYGPWQPFTLDEIRAALAGFERPWWVCGGVAIEAFTGVARHHDDVDIGFFDEDLPELCRALARDFDVWSAGSGMLRPIDIDAPSLHTGAEQVWIRAHAWAPWRLDALATPSKAGRWVDKREPSITLPLDDATWTRAGVRHLAPELVLLMKAQHTRPKDEADFEAALPGLDANARRRLKDWMMRCHRDHPWISQLSP